MTSPYINTLLNTTVRIHPNQMDNNIRKHIKNSVEREHLNKCFLDYGYLVKIHEIHPDYDAEIIAEDPMACALFKVRFSCTLCRPVLNSTLICKAVGITPLLIYFENGPIHVIVKMMQNYNSNIFQFNQKYNTWTAKKESKSDEIDEDKKKKFILLGEGMYFKVKIINKRIIDKSNMIICSGFLENVATEAEIEESNRARNSIDKYSSMKEYLSIEMKNEQINEDHNSHSNEDMTTDNDNDEDEDDENTDTE